MEGSTTVTVSVISGGQNPGLPESEMDALLLGRTKELVASSPSQRNWRGIFIALLVIAAVLGLIVFSIILLSPEDEGSRVKGRRITLSDINGNELIWQPFNGSWINDAELVYRDPTGGLSIISTNNLSTRTLMTNSTFRQLNAVKFLVSPDLNFVVLIADIDEDGAKHYVYELNTRNNFPLTPKVGERQVPKLQHVLWAPKVESVLSSNPSQAISQAIAFVYENDLYYKPKVRSDLVCRITTTGKAGEIYNGIPDWYYSHIPDLKSDTVAFSTDGAYLSYLSFNDTEVNEYKYAYLKEDSQYPDIKSIRYPKALTKNPNVTVRIVDLTVLKFINQITLVSPMEGNDNYVGQMQWISASDLSVTYTNRNQTQSTTVLCRAPSFICREVYHETIVDDGFVLPNDRTIFSRTEAYFKHSNFVENKTTNQYEGEMEAHEFKYLSKLGPTHGMLKRLPVRDGENGYFRHMVFISTTDMRTIPLTMGRFEVTEIVGWDEKNEIVYFMATPVLKPGQRHLYNISLRLNITENFNRIYLTSSPATCLTCKMNNLKLQPIKNVVAASEPTQPPLPDLLTNENGERNMTSLLDMLPDLMDDDNDENRIPNNCLYNKVYFSKNFSHYVQECLGPEAPSVYLVETATNTKVALLNGGDKLRKRVSQLATPQLRTFSVEIRHGFMAQVRLFLPPGMKEEEEIAFPLVLHIDSSPGSQLVSEKFNIDWNWYVSSQKGMIVAQIDARGTGYQGELLRSQIKNRLGSVEIEDQLGVLKYLRDNLKFIDPTRICSYGWGYGAYASTMMLAEDSQRILQCAFAVNPIVSFAYHNSYFADRYMPPGTEFQRAAQESDLAMRAGNIDSRNYLLIQSTADTLVHQQHSLILTKTLIDQGIGFRHQIYTNEDHYLKGALYHLYKTIDWFLDESFGPLESNEWEPTGFFAFKQ